MQHAGSIDAPCSIYSSNKPDILTAY